MVLLPNNGSEKQISTNSLFFGSGQASLDICLSFDCLRSSFKEAREVECIEEEVRRLRTAFKGKDL